MVGEVMGKGNPKKTTAASDDNFLVLERLTHGMGSIGSGCRKHNRWSWSTLTVFHLRSAHKSPSERNVSDTFLATGIPIIHRYFLAGFY